MTQSWRGDRPSAPAVSKGTLSTRALPALVALLVLGALPAAARAAAADEPSIALEPPRDGKAASIEVPFRARGDQVLAGAELHLTFAPEPPEDIRAVEVRVNGELLASFEPGSVAGEERTLTIEAEQLAGANHLSVRLVPEQPGPCGQLRPGAWSLLRAGTLRLQTQPLPLPDDLAVLPLPFIDRLNDREATIAFSLAATGGGAAATREAVRLAGLVAGWFGVQNGVPLRFTVAFDALPPSNAVVLVQGADAARRLGLPEPTGATARMVAHPALPGAKLLVLGGRDGRELEAAVRGLAGNRLALKGASVTYASPRGTSAASSSSSSSEPYKSARWLAPDAPVALGSIPGAPSLVHKGLSDATLVVPFRVAPDLWTWPRDAVALDLHYAVSGSSTPRLDLDFNGHFVATVPPAGGAAGTARVLVPASLVRGYNELALHISHSGADAACERAGTTAAAPEDDASVRILPDSTLHLEGLPHFARLPDVGAFVDDGWPFTRRADLAETAIVLPETPTASEAAALLSVLAHLASITGSPPYGALFLGSEEVAAHPERDLLVVGTHADLPLLADWAARFALGPGLAPQLPQPTNWALDLLDLRRGSREMAHAREVLARVERPGAAMGTARPDASERAAIAVTARSGDELPAMTDLRGFALSHSVGGDLLVAAAGGDNAQRWMFRLGMARGAGKLDVWTRVRWFMAQNPVTLVPCLLVGVLLVAVRGRAAIARMTARRLGAGGGDDDGDGSGSAAAGGKGRAP